MQFTMKLRLSENFQAVELNGQENLHYFLIILPCLFYFKDFPTLDSRLLVL